LLPTNLRLAPLSFDTFSFFFRSSPSPPRTPPFTSPPLDLFLADPQHLVPPSYRQFHPPPPPPLLSFFHIHKKKGLSFIPLTEDWPSSFTAFHNFPFHCFFFWSPLNPTVHPPFADFPPRSLPRNPQLEPPPPGKLTSLRNRFCFIHKVAPPHPPPFSGLFTILNAITPP